MREKYLTARDISQHLGVADRHIRRIASEEGWDYREVKKGKTREKRFMFSLLPASIQAKILNAQTTALSIIEDSPMNRISLPQYSRDMAESRRTAISLFKEFHKESGMKKDKALGKFVEKWDVIASKETLEILPKLSKQTLYRWENLLLKGGVVALAPAYGNRQGITKLPEQYHDLVLKAYLNQNQISAKSIQGHIIHQVALAELGADIDFIKLAERKRELSSILSEYVVRNFIKNQTTKGLRSLARGHKAEQDRILPHITRDRSELVSNEIWVSDGHDTNTHIIGEDGKTIRPVIVAWMDEKSRMIMGWSVDVTENTDLIIDSLCNAVEKHGIPQTVYIDNGKAYINKRTTSEDQEKYIMEKRFTTYEMLGCEVHRARPYNAREKSIERKWARLDTDLSKWLRGYAGKDILSKPKKTELDIKQNKLITLEEYKYFLEQWFIKDSTDAHTGEGMNGLSPYEVWVTSHDADIVYPDPEMLAQIRLVYMNDLRSITAGGKIRARNRVYIAPQLITHIGEKVSVGLDPSNLDRAYIFLRGTLLCIAENEIKADYTNTAKTQKAFRQQSKGKSEIKKHHKKILEIQKRDSAILLTEKTKVLESAPTQIIEKIEKFDRYNY